MVCCKCCQGCAVVCRLVTDFWLIGGIVFSSFALFSCQFAEQRRTGAGLGLVRSELLNEEFGYYQCLESVSENSGSWLYLWAMISGALAPIFGIAVFTFTLFDCCCKVCCSKFLQGFLFFCAIFNQGCTFLIYLSSPCYFDGNGFTCKIGWGAVFSMIAFGAYLIASLFLCFSPKHDPICCRDDEGTTCCGGGEAQTKQAAKEDVDEEQPAPVVAAAAVVQEEKKQQPEEVKAEQPQAVEEKEVAKEESVVAAVSGKDEEEAADDEASSAVSAKEEKEEAVTEEAVEEEAVEEEAVVKEEAVEEEGAGDDEAGDEEAGLEDQVKVSVKEEGISMRLDPSVTGSGPDPSDSAVGGEDPDGDKFVGESIKASPSLQTAPW